MLALIMILKLMYKGKISDLEPYGLTPTQIMNKKAWRRIWIETTGTGDIRIRIALVTGVQIQNISTIQSFDLKIFVDEPV